MIPYPEIRPLQVFVNKGCSPFPWPSPWSVIWFPFECVLPNSVKLLMFYHYHSPRLTIIARVAWGIIKEMQKWNQRGYANGRSKPGLDFKKKLNVGFKKFWVLGSKAVCGPKFMKWWNNAEDLFLFPTVFSDCSYHISFARYSPLSNKVGRKEGWKYGRMDAWWTDRRIVTNTNHLNLEKVAVIAIYTYCHLRPPDAIAFPT